MNIFAVSIRFSEWLTGIVGVDIITIRFFQFSKPIIKVASSQCIKQFKSYGDELLIKF
jgi:hypothetical protein